MSTSTGKRKRHSVTSTVRATSDHWLEMMPADEVTNGVRREAALWVRNKYLGIKVLRDFAHVPGGPFEAEVKDVWGNARTGQMLFHLGYSDGDKEYITWREINKLMISTAEIQRQRQRQLQYAQQQSCGNSGGGRGGSATQTQAKTKAKTKAQTKSQTKKPFETNRRVSIPVSIVLISDDNTQHLIHKSSSRQGPEDPASCWSTDDRETTGSRAG